MFKLMTRAVQGRSNLSLRDHRHTQTETSLRGDLLDSSKKHVKPVPFLRLA